MGPWAWRGYLATGVLLTGGYYLLPSGPQAVLYVVVGASCVAAVWYGASRNRPDRPAAWWLLGGGQLAFTAGDALFYVNELVLHIEPFPSVADGFYLAGYPLVAAGLALLIRGRVPRRDWRAVADATIIAVGFCLLSWVLVMVPYFRDPELTLLGRVFSLAYPVGDVLLLALAARLAVAPGRRTVAYPLLVASLVSTMAGDLLFSVLALTEQYTGISAADAAYLVGYLLLGAAALHPSMARLSQPAPERRARLPRGRLLAMGAAALVAPALLLVQRLQGAEIEVAPIAGGWTLLFVLVMVRMAGLVRTIERAEAERSRLLDRTIQVAEEERVQVAAELHDGPIQRLTVLSYDLEGAKQRLLGADPAEGAARLERAQSALSFEVQRLRQLMVALRPPALDEVGLEAALRDQVSAFGRRLGVDWTLRVALDGRRLGGELETVVYRITQEALLNVARHAHAGRIRLELEGVGDRVELQISDDGVGFEPVPSSVLVRDGHFGLIGMRERVEMAGGSWQVDARPGSGVTLRASFRSASTAA
jgi:signal transduction histidine kinase